MPAPVHVIVIAPLDKLDEVVSIIGIAAPTASLFTEADAAPRTETHRARSGAVTAPQRAVIDDHMTSPLTGLEGVVCALWPRDQPTPYDGMLTTMGLTTDDGTPH